MTMPIFVAILLGSVLAVYLGIAIRTWLRFRGMRVVTCPETRRPAGVTVSIGHAVATAIWERADLKIEGCSRWPERAECDEACAAQIETSTEDTRALALADRFFTGQRCVICLRRLPPLQRTGHQPGFMDPVTRDVVPWEEMPAEHLPDAIARSRALCPDCTLAESSRMRTPERVTDRP